MRRVVAVCLSMVAGGLGVTQAAAPPASAASWGPEVRIAYAQGVDIFVAHPSGTAQVNVTGGVDGSASAPSLSRTGRYVSYKIGLASWVYDFQSNTHTKVVDGGAGPDFSPAADTMAFSLFTPSPRRFNLFTMNADGTGLVNRTNETSEALNLVPTWGADGRSLLYSRSHGVRECRVDMGGYDDIHHALRLARLPLDGGAPVEVAGNDGVSIHAGAEGGGVLAYVETDLPPTGGDGYCTATPPTEYRLVINGSVSGPAWAIRPSVNAAGDVAYTMGGKVMVDPAGPEGPQELFGGMAPDWGVAYGSTTDCTVEGDDEDNRLQGTDGPDVICGYGGDDVILGLGGDDVILGGLGEDQLVGGPGQDTIDGGEDNDVVRGDEGNDVLQGGQGIDLITYFTSRRKLVADLRTGSTSSGDHGKDRVTEIESVFGSKTDDKITGDDNSNALYGGPGKDVVKGLGGTDLLLGNAGDDKLLGGAAADLLEDLSGKDLLDGGGSKDTCSDDGSGDKRRSCERVDTKDPKKTKGPRKGPGEGPIGSRSTAAEARQLAPGAYYWNLGNDDFLFVYTRATTQRIASLANAAGWESKTCYFIRFSPARGACSAAGALNAVQKYQMQWFLWNAKQNGGCAIGILDWGRHGVNQFKKRWKVRPAESARYKVAIAWVTAGRFSDVRTKDGIIRVTCS